MRRGRLSLVRSVSLLVWAAVMACWLASYRGELHVAVGRRTLRLWRGELTAWVPPSVYPHPAIAREAAGFAAQLHNDQIAWEAVLKVDDFGGVQASDFSMRSRPTAEQIALLRLGAPAMARELLGALDDPQRIAAAHEMLGLMEIYSRPARLAPSAQLGIKLQTAARLDPLGRLPAHACVVEWNGLRVEMWPDGAVPNYAKYPPRLRAPEGTTGVPYRLDPSSFAAVRDRWHRRWDIRREGARVWPVVVIASLHPAWLMMNAIRRRLFRPRGGCRACHYDLTGNASGVCPECGTVVAKGSP